MKTRARVAVLPSLGMRAGRRFLLVLVAALSVLIAGCTSSTVVPVEGGVLDLRAWSGEGVLVPHGDYRVDWDRLEPIVEAGAGDSARMTTHVPGNLGRHWPSRGPFGILDGAGCAVLSMTIEMPSNGAQLAFSYAALNARVRAAALDGNGATVEAHVGRVSCNLHEVEEVNFWQVLTLPSAKRVRLEVAVSPRDWGIANVNGLFAVGSPSAVLRAQNESLALRVGGLGVLLGLLAGALVLSVLRKSLAGSTELALFVSVLALRSLASIHMLEATFPRPWIYSVSLTIEYLAMPLGVAAGYAFFDGTLGLPRRARPWVYASAMVLALAIVFAPQVYMTGPVAVAAKAYTVLVGALLLSSALRWKDPTEPLATLAMRTGLVALFAGALLDIVRSSGLAHSPELMPLATVVFVFSQSVLVAMRYAAAIATAESLVGDVDKVNEDLREQGELVSEFMQSASSELLQPSAAVVALAEGTVTTHGRRMADEIRLAFELVANNGRRIAYLANELSDMSDDSNASPASDGHAMDAELLVRRAVETIRPMLSRRFLEVRVTVAEHAPALFGDVTRFERAIVSILGYAATYAESGTVSVSLGYEGGFAIVVVSANGRFLDPGSLISPFDTVRRLVGGGLPATRIGVGLSTARRTAHRHGGSLTVEVTAEVGATIRLALPAVGIADHSRATGEFHSAKIAIGSVETRAVRTGAGGRSVLVVDDDDTTRVLMRQALERRGFEVWLAQDGESAIDTILAAGPPHLVLMDVALAGMSGLQVVDVLRRRFDPGTLPIVLLTARTEHDDVMDGLRRGANDYLQKPVHSGELEARVAQYIANVEVHRAMKTELDVRRAHEGEIAELAARAGNAEQALRVLERARAEAEVAAELRNSEGSGVRDAKTPEP